MRRILVLVLPAMLALGGDCNYPKDQKGTLARVTGGVLRVGVADAPPWSWIDNQGRVEGIEVDLVRRFAEELRSDVQWETGSQHELLERLKRYELDVVIGGLTATSPWRKEIGFTRPYVTVSDSADERRKHRHVLALPPGENGLLMAVDDFLNQEKASVIERIPGGEP